MQPVAELMVPEQALHHGLAVVEGTVERDIVDVRRLNRRHLAALDFRHPADGVKHEDIDIVAVAAGLDRGRTGIARGRADHGDAARHAS